MALRAAERRQWRPRMLRRSYSASLQRIELTTLAGEQFVADLGAGVNVLTGGNGAGKSGFLGALRQTLQLEPPSHASPPQWLSSMTVSGEHGSAPWTTNCDFLENGSTHVSTACPFDVYYVDPAGETEALLAKYMDDPAVGDLIEGLDASDFGPEPTEWLAYLLRRSYESIKVFDITAFSEDDEPVPFFQLTSSGVGYSILGMGRGELCAAYLLWKLLSFPMGSLVLLEEPESHLAAFSQAALAEIIFKIAGDRDLTFIVSSHSPGFFAALPTGNVVLISSLPSPSVVAGLPTRQLGQHLGLRPRETFQFIAEDFVAVDFLRILVEQLSPELLNILRFKFLATGESGIRLMLDNLRSTDSPSDIVGVFDGDQRVTIATKIQSGFPAVILPGDHAPEVVIRNSLDRWRAGLTPEWGAQIPGGAPLFRMRLEAADGLDHHDWILRLSNEFGGVAAFIRCCYPLLMLEPEFSAQAQKLVTEIETRVDLVT